MLTFSEWDTNKTPSERAVIAAVREAIQENNQGDSLGVKFHHSSFQFLLQKIPVLYRYAFEGRLIMPTDGSWTGRFEDAVCDLIAVVYLMRSLSTFLHELQGTYADPIPLEMLLIAIVGRMKLDDYLGQGYLGIEDCPPLAHLSRYSYLPGMSIKEMAVLARLDERTVTNYGTRSQNKLLTFKEVVMKDMGNEVKIRYVEFEDAVSFLRGRRKFIPTSQYGPNVREILFG